MIPTGRRFYKMSGSGNDFVFVDARTEAPGSLMEPGRISALCARGTGVGADGVVFLERSSVADVKLIYINADGSIADLCGNATLCTTRLAVELRAAAPEALTIETGSGIVRARIRPDGAPEIDLQPVSDVRSQHPDIPMVSGESHLGFALVGVPHVSIVVDDVSTADVVGRGRPIRHHASLPAGANVNFVSRSGAGWRIRTFERGVEGETLACGTGAVASAILLSSWGLADRSVALETRSGRTLTVTLDRNGGSWQPSLSGAATVVFTGSLSEI
jgi:diaminopimelate epimerase